MINASENDTRSIRTKAAIQKTLSEMICEMPHSRITVSELTKRAGIHRKTFYLHYETLEGAFLDLADGIAEGMYSVVDSAINEKGQLDFRICIKKYAEYLSDNMPLHRKLFCDDHYSFIYNRVADSATDYLLSWLKAQTDAEQDLLEAYTVFVANGTNALWRYYYRSGRPIDSDALMEWVESITSSVYLVRT